MDLPQDYLQEAAVKATDKADGDLNIMDSHGHNDVWTLNDGGFFLDRQLLQVIGNLTHTTLEHRQDNACHKITIKTELVENANQAKSKLNVLSQHSRLKASAPYITNLPYCEAGASLVLQKVQLRHMEDRRLATTLVDPAAAVTKTLGSHLCIVLAMNDNEGVRLPLIQSVPIGRKATEYSKIWKDHQFKALHTDAAVFPSQASHVKISTTKKSSTIVPTSLQSIEDWSQMNIGALDNPFEPLPEDKERLRTLASTPNEDTTTSSIALTEEPERKRYAKKRKPQGTTAIQAIPVASHASPVRLDLASHHNESRALPPVEEQLNAGVSSPSYAPIHQASNFSAPLLAPPYMPPRSIPETHITHRSKPVQNPTPEPELLIDYFDDEPAAAPWLTSNKKLDLRQTMKQRKGRKQSSQVDSTLLQNINTAFMDALTLARMTTGQMDLSIKIGRLLLRPCTVSSKHKYKPFTLCEWISILPGDTQSSPLDCEFTPRLTAYAPDADFLLQLRYDSQRRIFSDEIASRSLVYCFHIQLSHDVLAILELNENGQYRITTPSLLLGAINWHFVKRYWDSRMELVAATRLSAVQEALVRDFVDKISILPSFNNETVKVVVTDPKLSITNVYLRRETQHVSETYHTIMLHLTNIEQLELDVADNANSYVAYSQAPRYAVQQGKLWWEASLRSTQLSELLSENEGLELGEMTKWKEPGIFEADALRHLEYCSRDVVTRIDTIGYYNQGPKTSSRTEASSDQRGIDQQQKYW